MMHKGRLSVVRRGRKRRATGGGSGGGVRAHAGISFSVGIQNKRKHMPARRFRAGFGSLDFSFPFSHALAASHRAGGEEVSPQRAKKARKISPDLVAERKRRMGPGHVGA